MDMTLTSMREPLFAKAGRLAVTITAAAFLEDTDVAGTVRPYCCSRLAMACLEYTVSLSPVLFRPKTTPNPVNWLARAPSINPRSLMRTPPPTALLRRGLMGMRPTRGLTGGVAIVGWPQAKIGNQVSVKSILYI